MVILVTQHFHQARQFFHPIATIVRGGLVGHKALVHLTKSGVKSLYLGRVNIIQRLHDKGEVDKKHKDNIQFVEA